MKCFGAIKILYRSFSHSWFAASCVVGCQYQSTALFSDWNEYYNVKSMEMHLAEIIIPQFRRTVEQLTSAVKISVS
jgi:hypothetical protein